MKITRVRRYAIYERDGWRCHLCGDAVDSALEVPAAEAPTLDHVVALFLGGDHSESNLRLAHFLCNALKGGNDVAEMLRAQASSPSPAAA